MLHLNDGSGNFAESAGALPALETDTNDIEAVDVDADGDIDLILGVGIGSNPPTSRQNRLYLNDGTGVFTDSPARLPAYLTWSPRLVTGDFDGNGSLDFAVLDPGATALFVPQIATFLNNGAGVFVIGPTLAAPVANGAGADVDGDGDVDLVTANGNPGPTRANALYLNDGGGAFADASSRLPLRYGASLATAAGDLDGDGDHDVVTALKSTLQTGSSPGIFLNDGTGSFLDATRARTVPGPENIYGGIAADVDGDGDPDFVFTSSGPNRVLYNDGYGFSSPVEGSSSPIPTTHPLHGVGAGDVDGDGDLDVAIATAQENVLLRNDGPGRFVDVTRASIPTVARNTTAALFADFDGDGDTDLFFVGLQHELMINDGSGVFTDVAPTNVNPSGSAGSDAWVGDVDGDGDQDVVVANDNQDLLYVNDGSARLTASPEFPALFGRTTSVDGGDVDGDGDVDLVFGNSRGPQAPGYERLFRNDGSGAFTLDSGAMPQRDDDTPDVALLDLDGDGDLDLIAGTAVYVNDGSGNFTDETVPFLGAMPKPIGRIAAGDFDGDGDTDLIGSRNGTAPVLYSNHRRQLEAPFLATRGTAFVLRITADGGRATSAGAAVPLVSAGPAHIDLGPLGVLRLDPLTLLALPAAQLPAPSGEAEVTVRIPNAPVFQGVVLHWQAIAADGQGTWALTNALRELVQ